MAADLSEEKTIAMHRKASSSKKRPGRTKRVDVKMTEDEYKLVHLKAKEAGLSMSSLLRDHLQKLTITNRDDEKKRLAVLSHISSNLNQIAKWVNTYQDKVDPARVVTLLLIFDRTIERLIERMEADRK